MAVKQAVLAGFVRKSVEEIAAQLDQARALVEAATRAAETLHREITDQTHGQPVYIGVERFDYDIREKVMCLARDLGADVDEMHGDFDLYHCARDAHDLVDLIDLATTPRAGR